MSANAQLSNRIKLAILGFGEAGQAFATGWIGAGLDADLAGFDIKTDAPATADIKRNDYQRVGVAGADSLAEAAGQATAVFSLVTADQAEAAAAAAADVLAPQTWFFDCNSCSPGTKRRNADLLQGRGIRYVDTAVMAPVHPKLHRTPLLVSGPCADEAAEMLQALDMEAKTAGPAIGTASATKMIRSVMVKGIEALTLECVLAGRRAGVDEAVIASLDASMPGWTWPDRAAYNMERSTTHGLRRAAEMREVARTVEELGLPSQMSRAIVEWQQRAGDLALDLAGAGPDYATRADRINAALSEAENAAEQGGLS
ncbi:NAD(P)-dependent oxidoreductase [Oceanicola sp. 502str15]|uniref:NAD(P)-dependent oxidoreductase n=1 Tax=Oceanicola sp. 502str15 TaxID=2696061 RepID=UPI0020963D97|nr:NAD(P)-dependent oxidoreductase [Oceanicola sp. 502str15]MCO6382917.1 DUF1932 domain-containing protein [Oceanicola sp. 502str15]